MKIELHKFGDLLISRPAGREAFLAAKAYIKPATGDEPIELDFEGVKVLAPSWADEFITGMRSLYGARVHFLPSKNSSVIESLKILAEP